MKNIIIYNKYSLLIGDVELSSQFSSDKFAIERALIKKCSYDPTVVIKIQNEYKPVGKISLVYGKTVMVDLLDNSYGAFVQHMLYRAVEYKLEATCMGQVSYTGEKLLGMKITRIAITEYTKWF